MGWGETASALDTIVAVATPPGDSPRALLRLSGPAAIEIVSTRLVGEPLSFRRHISAIRLRARVFGEMVEVPALALAMPGPATFTGEETVELLVAGSTTLVAALIDALCTEIVGRPCARRATAGEFSARAYLNGRLAADEAESIALSIAAESDAQLEAARRIGGGSVAVVARAAAEEVTRLLALVEAGIDFTDQEDVVAITASALAEALRRVDSDLARVEMRAMPAEAVRTLPTVALRGVPNAGKSSLFNALLGRSRSIESHVAGSTRDAIVEPLVLGGGVEALLVDLPGIEDPQGALAAQMQDLAHASLRDAAVQLVCVPVGQTAPTTSEPHSIVVRTKCDLVGGAQASPHEVATSARTGVGITALRDVITSKLQSGASSRDGGQVGLLAERHRRALAEARASLREALALAEAAIARGARGAEPVELVAVSLRRGLDELGVVAGDRTPDDVLAALFSRFCIGK